MTAAEQIRTAPYLSEVAEDVFAYIQPDGGWCVNNAGVVHGADTTVLIDTVATEARARALRQAIGAEPDLLVNTHHHGDHTFGNHVFSPGATIVAHEETRAEMIEAGLGLRTLWPGVRWGRTPLVLPQVTYRDRLTLHAGELRLELIHLGPAHTTNDTVVWVPERRVLFSGDILMSDVTPFCLMGSISGSLEAVRRIRALAPQVIVTGHGPVAGPEVLGATEEYLRFVTRTAEEGHLAGLSPLEVARECDLGAFAELLDSERLVGNLHRAYAELAGLPAGVPMEILGPFTEMVTYHGGPPACHA